MLQFTGSVRFMVRSLLNLVNNLSGGIHRMKCKLRQDDKNVKHVELNIVTVKYCDCFLEYIHFKDDLIEYKCLCCNKNYQHKLQEKLKRPFFNIYIFSNHSNKKFVLFLRKGVYPYEYMDD